MRAARQAADEAVHEGARLSERSLAAVRERAAPFLDEAAASRAAEAALLASHVGALSKVKSLERLICDHSCVSMADEGCRAVGLELCSVCAGSVTCVRTLRW